jgi:hypothetical protein
MRESPERGQFAGWIAPPKIGIDNKPGDIEYVKIAARIKSRIVHRFDNLPMSVSTVGARVSGWVAPLPKYSPRKSVRLALTFALALNSSGLVPRAHISGRALAPGLDAGRAKAPSRPPQKKNGGGVGPEP